MDLSELGMLTVARPFTKLTTGPVPIHLTRDLPASKKVDLTKNSYGAQKALE
jgi:hypothetical protein